MVPIIEVLLHSNYILPIIRIMLIHKLQQPYLHHSLPFQLHLVSHYFHCNCLLVLMVIALEDHAKGAFSQLFCDLKSECEMVVHSVEVFPVFVIPPPIELSLWHLKVSFPLKQI